MSTLDERKAALEDAITSGELSFTAVGLLAVLASVPDDYTPSYNRLVRNARGEQPVDVLAAVDELVRHGHLFRRVVNRDVFGTPVTEVWTVLGRTLGGTK